MATKSLLGEPLRCSFSSRWRPGFASAFDAELDARDRRRVLDAAAPDRRRVLDAAALAADRRRVLDAAAASNRRVLDAAAPERRRVFDAAALAAEAADADAADRRVLIGRALIAALDRCRDFARAILLATPGARETFPLTSSNGRGRGSAWSQLRGCDA